MGKFDTGSKRTIHLYARAWAEWIVAQQGLAVEAELSGEFQIVARATDVLLRVQDTEKGQFLSLTELQLQYRNTMPRRLAAYAALAREKYAMEVYVTVLYLTPPPEEVTLADEFHTEFMGQTAHQDIKVIRLWEIDAEAALALDNPALIPFVPLMHGGNTEQTLRKCVERLRKEPDAEELEAVLTLFANLVMNKEVVKRIVGWTMKILKESPFYQEITALAREEGREEGREEALESERLAHRQTLQRLLAYRYKVPVNHFQLQLKELDIEAIKALIDWAFTLETISEFEAKLIAYAQETD
ncbi:MAG: hypothetical protein R3E79_45610 [Caldilineaceae bacterium]